ncbi:MULTISPECIES: ATP-binding protein [Halocynthiibacter]|uniref:ATP-binding protein n=1 Tax=Halocynthiibacter TaxID=1579315 RepID=UPI0021F0D49B|nr:MULTISPECIES: ATP-binding protein [Halocynthiibacter]
MSALSAQVTPLIVGAVILLTIAVFLPSAQTGLAFFAAGLTLVFMAGLIFSGELRSVASSEKEVNRVAAMLDRDISPCFIAGKEGAIIYQNPIAQNRYALELGSSFSRLFNGLLANPASVVFRLQNKASVLGSAREDIVTRQGTVQLTVMCVAKNAFSWRVDEMREPANMPKPIDARPYPVVIASENGAIQQMNTSFSKQFGQGISSLDQLFSKSQLTDGEQICSVSRSNPGRFLIQRTLINTEQSEICLFPLDAQSTSNEDNMPESGDIPVPLLKIGTDGSVISATPLAKSLLAHTLENGTPISDVLEGLGRSFVDWLVETARGVSRNQTEFLKAKRSDKEVYVQVTLNRQKSGNPNEIVAVLNDATELKSLEAQFVQSQKMHAIGQLAGGVAHDFNNLLTAISGHCDLLLLRHDQGDTDYGDLIQIHQNANRAAALVSQLLAFSRKQNLCLEPVDLVETLSDLSHLLNRLVGEKTQLTLANDPDLPAICADKRQLEQVVMNLVVNARDAMPNGGEIRVNAQACTLREPLKRDQAFVPAGDYVVVRVTDEGIGIPPDRLPKIFEPFFTTKRQGEGTGLGLSTAYGIVKQSGGFIFVNSEPSQGTEFTLYFPAIEAELERTDSPTNLAVNEQSTKSQGVVLLVEDEAPVRAFASRALRMNGVTVLEAEDAESALKILEDETLKIDLFVTDVIMPGMDGPTWVKKAKLRRPDVKTVFVSGYAEEDFSDNQKSIKDSVFLPKPFSLGELTQVVQQQLS